MLRPLSNDEREFLAWLLGHGNDRAAAYESQLARAAVDSVCPCGCPAINLAIDGEAPETNGPMEVLADYQWSDDEGRLFGVFLFARGERLAGLEFWSIDGLAMPQSLPAVGQLRPLKPGSCEDRRP